MLAPVGAWFGAALLYLLAGVVFAAFLYGGYISITLNAQFGETRIGPVGRDIAVILDVFKIGMSAVFPYIGLAMTGVFRIGLVRALMLAAIAAFATLSIFSTYGNAISKIETVKGRHSEEKLKFDRLNSRISDVTERLNRLGLPRPMDVVQAEIQALEGRERFRSPRLSNRCTNDTSDASKAFCNRYRALKTELARSRTILPQIRNLRKERKILRKQLSEIDLGKVTTRSDVFAESFGRADDVNFYFYLFMAVLLEIATTTGFNISALFCSAASTITRRRNKLDRFKVRQESRVSTAHGAITDDPTGLNTFVASHVIRDADKTTPTVLFREAYNTWCDAQGIAEAARIKARSMGKKLEAMGFQRKRIKKTHNGVVENRTHYIAMRLTGMDEF